MDFVQLIVLVCAAANPQQCEEKRLTFESHGSLERCMMEAQPYLAEWSASHPDLVIKRYHCEWPGHSDENI
jgi:hypothetical protein